MSTKSIIFVVLSILSVAFAGVVPYATSYNAHTVNHAIATPVVQAAPLVQAPLVASAPLVHAAPAPLVHAAAAPHLHSAPVVAASPYVASPYVASPYVASPYVASPFVGSPSVLAGPALSPYSAYNNYPYLL